MTTLDPEILKKKKNLNYLKPDTKNVSREFKKMGKCLHQRIVELEFELVKELNEDNVSEMFAVEYYSNKTGEASQDYHESYETKLKDFITNKTIMKLLNKKIENEIDHKKKSHIKPKIKKQKAYTLFNTCVNKIHNIHRDSTPVKEKVSNILNHFNENIKIAENFWLDMIQDQEKKFLQKLSEKKIKKNLKNTVSNRKSDLYTSTKITDVIKLNSDHKWMKTPTKENTHVDQKIIFSSIAKIEAPYIKRYKISIFDVTDHYMKKVLYFIKLSLDIPMNNVVYTFENNFRKRIKLHDEYSEQIKELEILGKDAEYMLDDIISHQKRKILDEDSKFRIQLQRLKSKKFKIGIFKKEITELNKEFSQQIQDIIIETYNI